MTKRLLSLALSLAMVLTMTPLVAGAEGDAAMVTIGNTTLESGKYYVSATTPAENGAPAYLRMVDTLNEEPATGSYLEYKDGILTVHGSVELNCMATAVTVNGGTLTITGNDESSLTVTSSGMSPLYSSSTSTITLAGDFDITLDSSSAPTVTLNDSTLKTAEGYTGDIVFKNTSTSPVIGSAGIVNLNTVGNISFNKSSNSNPVIVSSALTLYANNITIEGGSVSAQRIGMVAQEDVLITANTTASMLNTMTDIAAGGNVTLINEGGMLVSGGLRLIRLNDVGKGGTVLLQGGTARVPLTSASSENFTISDYADVTIKNNDVNGTIFENPTLAPTVTNYDKLVLICKGKCVTTENGKTTTEYYSLPTDFTTFPTEPAVYPAGEGTAEFTPAREEGGIPTLTLKNATAGNIDLGDNSLNIVVEGENTIGKVEASVGKSVNINVIGDGTLKASTLCAGANGELNVTITGALELNSVDPMTNSKATISAKSIKVDGPHAFQPMGSDPLPVVLTATDGDIILTGENAGQDFAGSNAQLTLNAKNGKVIAENALFQGNTTITAKGDISLTNNKTYHAIVRNSLIAKSNEGNINIVNTYESGSAIEDNYNTLELNLSAPNGKVTISAPYHAIHIPGGTLTINAKEVAVSSSASSTPTINAMQLTIDNGESGNCDKVTITGHGGQYSDYAVVRANGTIKSNNLLIKAETGYAAAPQNDKLSLKGTGKLIGDVYGGTEHDATIEILGAPVSVLTSETLKAAKTKTVFNAGSGYAIYDPEKKTLLLQDAVISNAVSLPIDDVAVTINGSLTIESGLLQLQNATSVAIEENAPIEIKGTSTSLALPDSTTGDKFKALNLSGNGYIYYDQTVCRITTLNYELGDGVNSSANPKVYIKFPEGESGGYTFVAPKGYYPIALTAPTKKGYDFKGWYSDAEYSNKVDAIVANLPVNTTTNTLTLYAKWEKQAQNNGGSSGGSSSSSANAVTTPSKTENGTVSVGAKNAKKGDTVTITVTPKDGYQVGQVTVKDASGNTVAVKDLGGGKYSFVMPATKVSVEASFVEAAKPGADFADVAVNAWYKDAVDYVVQKGLMTGTGEKTFSPEAPMTRAMLMTVLARYAGEDTSGGATWYEKGMAWAVANGVSDGSNPAGNITREQLVTMLYRYAGSPQTSGSLAAFADADAVSAYAVQAMQWAVEQGIITGTTATTITPKGSATRAQVAMILMRFCQGRDA